VTCYKWIKLDWSYLVICMLCLIMKNSTTMPGFEHFGVGSQQPPMWRNSYPSGSDYRTFSCSRECKTPLSGNGRLMENTRLARCTKFSSRGASENSVQTLLGKHTQNINASSLHGSLSRTKSSRQTICN
jgi:hypothetical protein